MMGRNVLKGVICEVIPKSALLALLIWTMPLISILYIVQVLSSLSTRASSSN